MKGTIGISLFQIKVDDIIVIISVIFTISILMDPVSGWWEVNKGALVLYIQPDQTVLMSLWSWEITGLSLDWGSYLCFLLASAHAPCSPVSSGPKRLQADPGVQRETPGSSWLCLCRSLIPKARLVSQFRPCCCQLDFSAHLFRAFGLSFHLYPHIISGFLLCILLCFLMKPCKRKSLQTLQVAQ